MKVIMSFVIFSIMITVIAVSDTEDPLGNPSVRVERLFDAPIITPELHPSIGKNIQGPSLIRVPDWVAIPLGKYYLYFADHKGSYIRLAYANDLRGPWKVHPSGSLQLADSHFLTAPPKHHEKSWKKSRRDLKKGLADSINFPMIS